MSRERLDKLLVDRGLAPSRERARALILGGKVTVDGQVADKAGTLVAGGAEVALREQDHPYVSRGALKLVKALDEWGIDPTGRAALDVGASTGGFTDVLLRRGARRVFAIDVSAVPPLRRLTPRRDCRPGGQRLRDLLDRLGLIEAVVTPGALRSRGES